MRTPALAALLCAVATLSGCAAFHAERDPAPSSTYQYRFEELNEDYAELVAGAPSLGDELSSSRINVASGLTLRPSGPPKNPEREAYERGLRNAPEPPPTERLKAAPRDALPKPDDALRATDLKQDRVVIYRAVYRVGVGDVESALESARQLTDELGGYVQKLTANSILLRVPATKFDQASERIARMGVLMQRNVEAQDVTEKYVDLRLRLRAAEATLKRLTTLLEVAKDVESAIKIEKEIGRLTAQIETLKGKLRVLESQVAYSTIAIQFIERSYSRVSVNARRKLPFYWLRYMRLDDLLAY